MSYKYDCLELAAVLAVELQAQGLPRPAFDAASLAEILLREAKFQGTMAIAECNREVTEEEGVSVVRSRQGVRNACKAYGIIPLFGDDPRGPMIRLVLPKTRAGERECPQETGWVVPEPEYKEER